MTANGHETGPFVQSVVAGIQEKNVPFMAAGIAYQAFTSLIPLLVLVVFFASIIGDEQLDSKLTAMTEGLLPASGQLLLESGTDESAITAAAFIIGLAILVWGTMKIFLGLHLAFAEIYGSTGEKSLLGQLRDAFVVFGTIVLAFVTSAGATIAFVTLPNKLIIGLVNPVVLIGGLALAFFPMYYFFPDADVSVQEIIPGVIIAAVGWTLLQSVFQVYIAIAASSNTAGPIGAILLLLTWLYFGGLSLLVGAVVNATRSGRLTLEKNVAAEGTARDREIARVRQTNERLREQAERLQRERNKLQQDLEAQRVRRYRLEDRIDDLEARTKTLEVENKRLRRELDSCETFTWRQALRAVTTRIETARLGSIDTRRE